MCVCVCVCVYKHIYMNYFVVPLKLMPYCEWTMLWLKKNPHNEMLLSHKKEQNSAICRDVEGTRDCHTGWGKSERDKLIKCGLYVGSREWWRWTYLQSRNRVTDIENKLRVTKWGKKGWDGLEDWGWRRHPIGTRYRIDSWWNLL